MIWAYHLLGWSTRRIAGEVKMSQASVVRALDRMKKEPPPPPITPPEGWQAAATPARGIPAVTDDTPPKPTFTPVVSDGPTTKFEPAASPPPVKVKVTPAPSRTAPPGTRWAFILAAVALLLTGVMAGILAAVAGGAIQRGAPGPAGQAGPPGPSGSPGSFTICVRTDTANGDVASITAPQNGKCGNATLVRIP
jgi:hypothetical protein